MAMRMRDAVAEMRPVLRFEPTEKRIRVLIGDRVVVDTTRAVLVWEPRRIVASYAVPVEELRAELAPDGQTVVDDERPLLHPGIPFAVHSTPVTHEERDNDPFDLEKLRLSQDFKSLTSVKKLVTTVKCDKPNPQVYVRVRPGEEWRLTAECVADGRLRIIDELVHDTFGLDDVMTAFALFETPGAVTGKLLFAPDQTQE